MREQEEGISVEDVLKKMERLARGKVNDAVKLAFLDEAHLEDIRTLDLTALTEFKRSGSGAVEIKLVDRLKVLERMAGLAREKGDSAAGLLLALEQTAETEETGAGQAVLEKAETGPQLVV